MAIDPESRLGMYNKFVAYRNHDPEGKHDDCDYFVFDLKHDKHARVAMLAYADAVEPEYPLLARDIRTKAGVGNV